MDPNLQIFLVAAVIAVIGVRVAWKQAKTIPIVGDILIGLCRLAWWIIRFIFIFLSRLLAAAFFWLADRCNRISNWRRLWNRLARTFLGNGRWLPR